jgi:4-amino-4-deoxy-L-arabinose transferase-like glycosyltransferase
MLNDPFALEPHAWASAHMALLANSFAQLGVVHLRGVPLQNNLPVGLQPDRYFHWPPLYPMLLGLVFRMFGESEAVVHSFVIIINVCLLLAFYFLVRRCFDTDVAILSLFALLTIPVFVRFGRLAWTPNAALALVCAALYCFVRGTETKLNWKWVWAGAVALTFGVLFSWETVLLGPILLSFGIWQRSRVRQIAAATYAAVGLGTVAVLLVLLVSSNPQIRNDLWSVVRYRMGMPYQLADVPIHSWGEHEGYTVNYTVMGWVAHMLDNWAPLLGGSLGLIATLGLVVWSWNNRKNRPDVFFVLGGLLGIIVVWVALFPNHVFNHEYQALFAAPLVCIGLGVTLKAGGEWLNGKFRWLVTLVLPLILIAPLARLTATAFRKVQPSEFMEYAKDIESNTPTSAVVLSTLVNMEDVSYSHRHIIRGVESEEALRSVTHQTDAVFPGSNIYIAIPPNYLGQFPCASSRFSLVKRTSNIILLKVAADACG